MGGGATRALYTDTPVFDVATRHGGGPHRRARALPVDDALMDAAALPTRWRSTARRPTTASRSPYEVLHGPRSAVWGPGGGELDARPGVPPFAHILGQLARRGGGRGLE